MNDDVFTDRLLGGRLTLRQSRRGHRAGTDAVLLAASVRPEPGDRLVDVGAGVGTVGLALGLRRPDLTGFLLEADPETAALARDNCRLNALEERLAVVEADLFDPQGRRHAGLEAEQASLLVTNPPFLIGSEARVSGDAGRARAHVLDHRAAPLGHGDWLQAALSLLAPKGRLFLIHRPEALPALLAASDGRLGGIAITPILAKADAAAIRIEPGLVLHDAAGRFTPEAERLHRGEPM